MYRFQLKYLFEIPKFDVYFLNNVFYFNGQKNKMIKT